MTKSKLTDVDICRIWDLHKLGVPNTKIAIELCVSERTIRYHLGRPTPNATGVFRSLSGSEINRKETIVEILDRQIMILSDKLQNAEEIKITKTGEFLKATQALADAISLRSSLSDNALTTCSTSEKLALSKLKTIQELPADVRRKLIAELKSGS